MTGRSCHDELLGFTIVICCTADARTLQLNCTASGWAVAATHDPESVKKASSPPSTRSLTRSTRRSAPSSRGSKPTSNLTSWPGARKPSCGKMEKCGASAATSQTNFAPVSPAFSSWRRLVVRLPFATAPNGSVSDARRSSMPRHAPLRTESVLETPQTRKFKGCEKGRMRCCGLKKKVRSAASPGRNPISELGTVEMERSRRRSVSGLTSTVAAARPRLTSLRTRVTLVPLGTGPRAREEGMASMRKGVPSPFRATGTV
mmetsp:Transcript_7249/g.14314  ORF Transcript_7249/g.14314 Transcript_7249/m.14314 type:complete len:260 (+) Transcript_7249:952-1731(+)